MSGWTDALVKAQYDKLKRPPAEAEIQLCITCAGACDKSTLRSVQAVCSECGNHGIVWLIPRPTAAPAKAKGRAVSFTILGSPRTKKTSSRFDLRRLRPLMLPSKAHEEWFKAAMQQVPGILRELVATGAEFPFSGPVEVSAMFYRKTNVGDLLGYEQALADWLQEPRHKPKRNGAGIIVDDAQIESWDGSRRAKDAERPRIEVTIREIGG